jgi:hypothetical protein
MKQRCLNPSSNQYRYYGGRGITICDKWREFEGFWEDMQHGYSDGLSIDRINNNEGYKKENCRWVNQRTQINNRRNTIMCDIDGIVAPLSVHCERLNMKYSTVIGRMKHHMWSAERALQVPISMKHVINAKMGYKNMKEHKKEGA